jgi:hypothetical protein
MLPVPYFHITVTVPAELREVLRANQRDGYGVLMQASAAAIIELARDLRAPPFPSPASDEPPWLVMCRDLAETLREDRPRRRLCLPRGPSTPPNSPTRDNRPYRARVWFLPQGAWRSRAERRGPGEIPPWYQSDGEPPAVQTASGSSTSRTPGHTESKAGWCMACLPSVAAPMPRIRSRSCRVDETDFPSPSPTQPARHAL